MKKIVELLQKHAQGDGITNTILPGVKIYQASQTMPRNPLLYSQGIIYMAQGAKKIYLGDKMHEYGPSKYIVLGLPLPMDCEAIAIDGKPLLALIVDIEISVLNNIINEMGDGLDSKKCDGSFKEPSLFTENVNDKFLTSILRILETLDSVTDAKILGEGLIKELVYRVMCGESADCLYALATKNTKLSKIDKALKEIHANYQKDLNVEKLAGIVNMSVSAFHHTFKDVTASSPIQYIKKVRLSKARDLIRDEELRINEAARSVGYESVTQFSREFKRYFGSSPSSL
jgi:AraC-like DNA-binding protein